MHQEDVSDEKLMASVAGGDETALEKLYDRHAAQVRGLALRILQERTAAEEVVQETFMRVWSSSESYDAGQGTFKNWMFTIAHRLSIDTVRRHKSRPQVELDEKKFGHVYHPSSRTDELNESIWQDERSNIVKNAVAQLPEEQAEIILLSYFQGLTRQEISERTATPLGTVHSRARLAMDKLRSALDSAGIKVR
jgi:RNA polymerase sigma-70 factor (ECF subfamily)